MAVSPHGPRSAPVRFWHTIYDTIYVFSHGTTIAGISHAGRSQHFLRRLCWLALFAAGAYCTTIIGLEIYEDYFSYPVTSSSNTTPRSPAIFPAVTICNQNRIRCSSLIRNAFRAVPGATSQMLSLSGCLSKGGACPMIWNELIAVSNVDPTGLYNTSRCFSKCDLMNDWRASLFQEDASFKDQQLSQQLLDLSGCSPRPLVRGKRLQRTEDFFELEGRQKLEDLEEPEAQEFALEEQATRVLLGAGDQFELDQGTQYEPQEKEDGDMQSNFTEESRVAFSTRVAEEEVPAFDLQAEFLKAFAEMDPENRSLLGYTSEDMITSCRYMRSSCSVRDFAPVQSNTYGNCYTYNSAILDSADHLAGKRTTSLIGTNFGLNLQLRVRFKDYLRSSLSPQTGLRIVLHPPGKFPLIDQEGINLTPAFATSIAVSQRIEELLPSPYSSACLTWWNQTRYQPVSLSSKFREEEGYSQERCQDLCLQDRLQRTCRCLSPYLTSSFTVSGERLSVTEFCDLSTLASQRKCYEREVTQFEKERNNCGCRRQCKKLQYDTKISYTSWPPVEYLANIALSEGREINVDATDLGETLGDLAKDYAMVDIFFETMDAQVLHLEPKYKLLHLFVVAGAILSLFLGISLIMFVEILEFLLNFFVNFSLFVVGKYSRPPRDLRQGPPLGEFSGTPRGRTVHVAPAPSNLYDLSSAHSRSLYGSGRRPHRDAQGYYARLTGPPPSDLPPAEEVKTLRNSRAKPRNPRNHKELFEFFKGI